MGQEKSQGDNDSRLESGLGRAFPPQQGAQEPAQESTGRTDTQQTGRECWKNMAGAEDWTANVHLAVPALALENNTLLQRDIRTTGLGELPGCKWTLSSSQSLPCITTLSGLALVPISGQLALIQASA